MCSCSNIGEEDIRIEEYGEQYAIMDCWWSRNEGPNTLLFWCDKNLERDRVQNISAGYLHICIIMNIRVYIANSVELENYDVLMVEKNFQILISTNAAYIF